MKAVAGFSLHNGRHLVAKTDDLDLVVWETDENGVTCSTVTFTGTLAELMTATLKNAAAVEKLHRWSVETVLADLFSRFNQ